MVTRALLLLLAMMTGLSAAQAAGSARPVPDQVAVSKSHVQLVQASSGLCAAKVAQAASYGVAGWGAGYSAPHNAHVPDRAPYPCTYHSERRRE